MVGAIGAFSFRDGIATGGQVRSPICRIGNVEHNEQSFPLLTLYRRENTCSGPCLVQLLDYVEGHSVIQRLNEALEGWAFDVDARGRVSVMRCVGVSGPC